MKPQGFRAEVQGWPANHVFHLAAVRKRAVAAARLREWRCAGWLGRQYMCAAIVELVNRLRDLYRQLDAKHCFLLLVNDCPHAIRRAFISLVFSH